MAQSNGRPVAPLRGTKKHLKDDDLFACTLNGKTHHVKWKDIITLALRPPSKWHIKDVASGFVNARFVDEVFDMSGNRVSGPAENFVINPGEERIVIGNDVRFFSSTASWNFGDQTDTEFQLSFDYLCQDCPNFNGDIQHLDVTEWAFDISYMFASSSNFNQPVSHFNTKNVNTIRAFAMAAFGTVGQFTQPMPWDTGNCQNMMITLQYQGNWNQDVSGWDVSKVKNMNSTFRETGITDPKISNWNTSQVETLSRTFRGCRTFNGALANWNTGKVTDMLETFYQCEDFNQNIGGWNTSKVENMQSMFYFCTSFNQDLGGWDVTKVKYMAWMFNSNYFLIGNGFEKWKTPECTDMKAMFGSALQFSADLRQWCVPKIPTKPDNFDKANPLLSLQNPIWGTCP
ncbi:membrane-associated lipoprotein precursor [uncultured phage_MedDCM-OCT-S31-C1]|uniref:Membrane-associated lipoprotein n=1 Tax=uncultured phage_MedDCM-OCT-S31-C1 TaxID=2740800 RepID=A0A6S4P7W2_9CAUD|nr:membrane-associated lipoprotein precursor [uncultured phage_MedDCM-OCT-S31-C1]BAQ94391.1 membrane-associated lipoprotein precursor [uncultured phage_MedDCM-OCT-S31-C1]